MRGGDRPKEEPAGKARLVLALDPPLQEKDPEGWAVNIAAKVAGRVLGYKLGLPLALTCGLKGVARVVSELKAADASALVIADFKVADVCHVNERLVKAAAEAGFDAIIVHAFVGYAGGVECAERAAAEAGIQLFLLVATSNPGASEVADKCLEAIISNVLTKADFHGLVAPATRPELIAELRRMYPRKVILAPGVGAQGAKPGSALCAGADAEIVGRLITASADPRKAFLEVARLQSLRASRCPKT